MAWAAIDEGYLAKHLVPADANKMLPVNEPIAVFVENEADCGAFKDSAPSALIGGGAQAQQVRMLCLLWSCCVSLCMHVCVCVCKSAPEAAAAAPVDASTAVTETGIFIYIYV